MTRPRQRRRILSRTLAYGALVAVAACGGGETAPAATVPQAITLDRTVVSLLGLGVTAGVQATVTDQRGQTIGNASPSWSSSNTGVVTVSSAGAGAVITSVGPGSAVVTASVGNLSATVSLDVAAELRSMSVSPTAVALIIDDQPTAQLTVTSVVDPGVSVTYTWASSNPAVATLTATGAAASVAAVSAGVASVTVTGRTTFGTTRTASVDVNVARAVRAVALAPRAPDVTVGREVQLTATVSGEATFPRTVDWSSSNVTVASVNASGLVSGVVVGTATIRAVSTADPSIRDSVLLTVTALPLSVADFVLLPAGTFDMGAGKTQVTLTKSFLIQKTEVTQAQWKAVMGFNPSQFLCGDNCPVESVSWENVQLFIERLNTLTPGVTYRLPTEAEWEYAARATTTDNSYGPISQIAWYVGNAGGTTHSVRLKAPNLWGLYDVLGNVEEYVQDWPAPLPTTPVVDPTGPATGSGHLMRGGHAAFGAGNTPLSVLVRNVIGNNASWEYSGFRLARNP